jgi:hypothetical protein
VAADRSLRQVRAPVLLMFLEEAYPLTADHSRRLYHYLKISLDFPGQTQLSIWVVGRGERGLDRFLYDQKR